MSKEIPLITAKDLSLVSDNRMNEAQLKLLLQPTPKKYIRTRPAKGGGTWEYVSGGHVKKVLNLMFGWDWDFEIIKGEVIAGEALVLGRLKVRTGGREIIKEQYGNKEIIYKTEKVFDERGLPVMITKNGKLVQETKSTDIPLSIGNDMKAAATDALKKCASEFGIAADIYAKEDFKAVEFQVEEKPDFNPDEVRALIELCSTWDEVKAVIRDYPKVSLNADLMKLIKEKKDNFDL